MRKCRVWTKTALCALAMVAGGAGIVAAQAPEVSLSNLALKNRYLKMASEPFWLGHPQWTNIFSPTAITCPGASGTCTAEIEVFAYFGQPQHYIHCRAIRSGGVIAPIAGFPGEVSFLPGSHVAFKWIFTRLPLGTTTIAVQCQMSDPAAVDTKSVTKRSLTIDVYKP